MNTYDYLKDRCKQTVQYEGLEKFTVQELREKCARTPNHPEAKVILAGIAVYPDDVAATVSVTSLKAIEENRKLETVWTMKDVNGTRKRVATFRLGEVLQPEPVDNDF